MKIWGVGGKHSCKFSGLQQIVELCSHPNVAETNREGLSGTEIPAPSVECRRCMGRSVRNGIVQGEPFPSLTLTTSGSRHFRNFLSQRS